MAQHGKVNATRSRLPVYLSYLQTLQPDPPLHISSSAIASALGMGEVQVRKDLASVCSGGKPKVGYLTGELMESLRAALGYTVITDAVLVGAGKLGKALLDYEGFCNYGLNIVAAFDANEASTGYTDGGKRIYPLDRFPEICEQRKIRMGIITVPAAAAQSVGRLMVENGILAIWNFAPVHLDVSDNILVQNENMACALAQLSAHLAEQLSQVNQ